MATLSSTTETVIRNHLQAFREHLWSTPVMTAGHLLFAAGASAYILVGVWFEERDLVAAFGERYLRYRTETGMLLPRLRRARSP